MKMENILLKRIIDQKAVRGEELTEEYRIYYDYVYFVDTSKIL